MKKALKIFIIISCSMLIIILSCLIYFFAITSNVKLDKNKLINMERITSYYDINGNKFKEESDGISVTDLKKMPKYVKNAFIAIEDKRFYTHNGIDYHGLVPATLNNIKSFSFKEGASTISQQLIKNTHLTNEKTLRRKLYEIKLAKDLEKNYSKDEIIEKYLNTIYFGDGCYGITSASKHYFNKKPEELTINESAILASIIKAPSYYSPLVNADKCKSRKNLILTEMYKQGYISQSEYELNIKLPVETIDKKEETNYNFFTLAKNEYSNLIKNYPYKYTNFNVYTTLDPIKQNILESEKLTSNEYENTSILINKKGQVVAYCSTCTSNFRQPGSTLKPILVYAPTIETNIAYSCSPILDEKVNYNGYCPSNYNDKYYGYVSVKESLSKSLNSCAVKLLNSVGIEKAKQYVNKTDIKLDNNDNSLCLALGATYNGVKLEDITSAYSTFINNGDFISSSFIDKITTDKGEIIFKNNYLTKNIFSEETVDIMNDMLRLTVTDGTAKKLSYLNFPIYAKTGTVGNTNGNTDAYSISFTSEYVLGAWCGNKENTLMSNSITGGNMPTLQASYIWGKIYNKTLPNEIISSDKVKKEYIDSLAYNTDHKVVLADLNAPQRYKQLEIFKSSNLPKSRSTRFTVPTIEKPEISVYDNKIKISLCLTEYINARIYRLCENRKTLRYDTDGNNKSYYVDSELIPNKKYTYSIIPYFKTNDKKYYGNEIILDTIKLTPSEVKNWWKNELD